MQCFKLDSSTRKFVVDDYVIPLRNKEFILLKYLFQHIGKVVTRTELLEEVWDRNICCATNTVDVHVSGLRQKFKKYLKQDLIRTVYCIGYVFDFQVN